MRIFVTGASGWIGTATVAELLEAGHQVVGLARSDTAAATIAAAGAQVRRGSLHDLDVLAAGAADCDGVVHLGYSHDFTRMEAAAATDAAALTAILTALEGTGRPLAMASGVLGLVAGRTVTEQDAADPGRHPRIAAANTALSYAERGVRTSAVRFAPTVHGPGDHGFIAALAAVARDKGVSAYVGDGASRWPAVHRLDAARLVRLAVEQAPAGTNLHAVAEQGVPSRDIAEAIGRSLNLPVASVPADQAAAHFGWIGPFFAIDCTASSALTQERFGWRPEQPGLIADLDAGHYRHR
jgi:nucleoside-diphosphate-sugar epimerase